MRLLIPLTIMVSMLMFYGGQSVVSGQENERAERELAEELAIEQRLMDDLKALKAEESKIVELQAKQKAKLKARRDALKTRSDKEKAAKDKARSKNSKRKKSDDSGVNGTITINGKKIEFDGKDVEKWMNEHGQELESWAEKHASEWENWAEKFESHMENWAEGQEEHWEKWADQYSERWEAWGEKLESGEIDHDEIAGLVEQNLEMLSDIPLGDLIEGALKEGLGELENAPWESLGELHELVGGSVEHALEAMEHEVASALETELKGKLSNLNTADLKSAIGKLQSSIKSKQKKSGVDVSSKLAEVKELLKQNGLDENQRDQIAQRVERELQRAMELEKRAEAKSKLANENARTQHARALELSSQARKEAMKAALAQQQRAIEMQKAATENAMAQKARKESQEYKKLASMKKSLEKQYAELKQHKEDLESK